MAYVHGGIYFKHIDSILGSLLSSIYVTQSAVLTGAAGYARKKILDVRPTGSFHLPMAGFTPGSMASWALSAYEKHRTEVVSF